LRFVETDFAFVNADEIAVVMDGGPHTTQVWLKGQPITDDHLHTVTGYTALQLIEAITGQGVI
jgi:hypothetical protein